MNLELLEGAKARVDSIPILVNMVSKRVKQLNMGMRPYVRPDSEDEDKIDTALREIANGKLTCEVDAAAMPGKGDDQEPDWNF